MLKKYWGIVARSQEQLIQNKGVESVIVSIKMDRKNNHKQKQVGGLEV